MALPLLGRLVIVAAVSTFWAPGWPLFRAVSLACLLPGSRNIPGAQRLVRMGAQLGQPVLALCLAAPLAQRLLPDEHRTLRMWRQFLPIYVGYLWTRWCCRPERGLEQEEVQRRWLERHEWGGKRVHRLVLDLSGYYVKTAQIMASKGDFMPPAWTCRLSQLFDSMPPRPWREVRHSLQRHLRASQLGRGRQELDSRALCSWVFARVEEEPIASASIAQVHAGELSEGAVAAVGWRGSRNVVLKVQHQHMAALMASDLRNIGRVAGFLRSILPFDIMPMVREVREAVPKEFDFSREARIMSTIRARLAASGHSDIHIPRHIPQLSTRHLLVMEHMQGEPFTRILPRMAAEPQLHEPAARAVRRLVDAYGQMMLRDGLFQADPHPGNLLLRPDGGLVLLDFGQCKALPARTHAALAALIVALADGDPPAIAAEMARMGLEFRARAGGPAPAEEVAKMAYIFFDTRYLKEATVMPLSQESLIKEIPLTAFPSDIYLIVRTLMLLRGLCHALHLDIKAAEVWREYACAYLADDGAAAAVRAEENLRIDLGPENGSARR